MNHISLSSISNSGLREGRLVREDGAGDGSDEDPDRIDVRGVAPETSRKERMKKAREEVPGKKNQIFFIRLIQLKSAE